MDVLQRTIRLAPVLPAQLRRRRAVPAMPKCCCGLVKQWREMVCKDREMIRAHKRMKRKSPSTSECCRYDKDPLGDAALNIARETLCVQKTENKLKNFWTWTHFLQGGSPASPGGPEGLQQPFGVSWDCLELT